MQGLSSRAHAFSVEALVGKTCKKMKVENIENEKWQSVSENDRHTPTGTVFDERDLRNDRRKKISATSRKSTATECESSREVRVDLQGSDLWKRFHEIGTEMIITKAGRRMFPSVRVKVRNLNPFQQYYIAMDIMPVDSKRYRYVYHSSQWMVAGNTDPSCISSRLYVHPDSPCSGENWMRQVISFDRIKLTNNEMDDKGHIILKSMHRYKPRIHVILHDPRVDLSHSPPSLPADGVHTFSYTETQFTTVTAYQNQQITKLKIDRNPFAKGFRDPGRNRVVLDGILESYPWHSTFSLHLKPFTMELQGRSGSSANFGITSPWKVLLPSSCSPAAHAITFSSPQCFTSNSLLTNKAYCNLGLARHCGYAGLPPLLDLPLMSPHQEKKANSLQNSTTSTGSSVLLIQNFPLGRTSGEYQSQKVSMASAPASPYRVYSHSFPMSRQFSTVTHQLKLGDGGSASHLMPINSSISYCF
ncbi:T-box transcription factor TBX22-like [Xyrauchen texanus]|uniref:T-box transcription factor TBX22-like n=1 Tax=Xyrauchen texanus TaxID=154827 RepID=UPI002241983F|nr:T-box transcription factor TBX22-like [Xyrauchen texanus]